MKMTKIAKMTMASVACAFTLAGSALCGSVSSAPQNKKITAEHVLKQLRKSCGYGKNRCASTLTQVISADDFTVTATDTNDEMCGVVVIKDKLTIRLFDSNSTFFNIPYMIGNCGQPFTAAGTPEDLNKMKEVAEGICEETISDIKIGEFNVPEYLVSKKKIPEKSDRSPNLEAPNKETELQTPKSQRSPSQKEFESALEKWRDLKNRSNHLQQRYSY